MRTKTAFAIVVLLLLLVRVPGRAQSAAQGSSSGQDQQGEGVSWRDWNVQGGLTLGYRWLGLDGNGGMYNTLTNLHEGFRVLDETLAMRSKTHTGMLFDNLYISSFGWNGDPYNAARWRISKNKLYDFSGSFRRDQNFFDYDLLANPLNPPALTPTFAITDSPHSMALRRRMTDMALTILPQSAISVRLGYMRNNMTGPSFSSVHEGTDALLLQPWNTTMDQYRFGVDVKLLPRTIISYDQFLDYFRNDTDQFLSFFPPNLTLADGTPIALGLPWNVTAGSGQPCNTPILGTGFVNPACNGYQSYSRAHRFRTHQPTEQLTIQSNYFRRVDFVAHATYSSNHGTDNWLLADGFGEQFLGTENRAPSTAVRQAITDALSRPRQLSTTIDAGATIHLSDTWRIPIFFRSADYRVPGFATLTTTEFSSTFPAALGGPLGTAVVTTDTPSFTLNNKYKYLQGELEHDFTRHFGARIGFRWTRHNTLHWDFSEPVPDLTRINEYTGLAGVWYRAAKFRGNLDVEAGSADTILLRIDPRHQQRYRARISYTPKPWAVATAYGNFWESVNGDSVIRYRGRTRSVGFDLNVAPNQRYGLDVAYNFNLFSQSDFVCFIGSFSPTGTFATTPADPCGSAGLPSEIYSFYNTHVHYFSTTFYFQPIKRVTANFGYALDHSDGDFTRLNTLLPLGGLRSDYHQPLANLAIQMVPHLTWNLGWNYWSYKDDNAAISAPLAPTLVRNFHANLGTLSLRYSF
jgi:hypothetical protein